MYPVIDNSPHFQRLATGRGDFDLLTVALEVARDAYPDMQPARLLHKVDDFARRARSRLGSGPERWMIVEAINHELFDVQRLRGNEQEYYDPRNSYLNEVIERRLGIPLTLSLVYMAVADRVGLPMAGVNLPAHFVVRTEIDGETVFLDPYGKGRMLDSAGIARMVSRVMQRDVTLSASQLEPCGGRVVIGRMLQNLKLIYLRARQFEAAIPVLKRLALINRDTPEELRDLGIVCFYEQRRAESLGYLLEYLRAAPAADDADEIRLLLRSAGIP